MEQRHPSRKPKKEWGASPKQAKRLARQGGASGKPGPESALALIQDRLNRLFPDPQEQIAWMETVHPLFAVSPLEMIHSGSEGLLLAQLDEWLRE
jgi:hypothetical protein